MECDNSSETGINFATFNQDATYFGLATKEGFTIYSISPFNSHYTQNNCARAIVEMMFETPLIALVGTGEDSSVSQRKLELFDLDEKQVIGNSMNFLTAILAVKFNKQRMLVILENKIIIHSVENLKLLKELETSSNSKGLCALSSGDSSILAYPLEDEPGSIAIYDCLNEVVIQPRINTHQNTISALALNSSGDLVASASVSGTVIRVFNTTSGDCLHEFRRGSTYASIVSISFSQDSTLLVVSSDKPTIHIFRLESPIVNTTESYWGAYVPTMVSKVWDPLRNFAHATNPNPGKSLAVISDNNKFLYVITDAGQFLEFEMNSQGGACQLLSQRSIKQLRSDSKHSDW